MERRLHYLCKTKQSQNEADDVANKRQKTPSRALFCCKCCTEGVAKFGIVEKATIASPVFVADFDKATVEVQGYWHRFVAPVFQNGRCFVYNLPADLSMKHVTGVKMSSG